MKSIHPRTTLATLVGSIALSLPSLSAAPLDRTVLPITEPPRETTKINEKKVGEGKIAKTQPLVFSGDETADIGIDLATPVVEAIGSERKSKFTGRIPKLTVEVKC